MSFGTVRVKGLAELNRSFKRVSKDLNRDMRGWLRDAAEPVRARAEELAQQRITNIGDRWSQMRVGVTTRAVYVAPKRRGGRQGPQRRPNLGPLLMNEAMTPALEEKHAEVVAGVEHALDLLTARDF